MDNITLTIGASKEGFGEWLGKYTMLLPHQDFPTAKGRLVLQRAEWDGPGRMSCRTDYAHVKGDVEYFRPMPPAITADLVELASERLHVTAECTQTVVLPYFADLLRAVSKVWPEAAQDVGKWLAAHGFDAPTSEESAADDDLAAIRDDADRQIVRLWRDGYTASEIASEIGFAPKTVSNRICELRREHGPGVVPRRR